MSMYVYNKQIGLERIIISGPIVPCRPGCMDDLIRSYAVPDGRVELVHLGADDPALLLAVLHQHERRQGLHPVPPRNVLHASNASMINQPSPIRTAPTKRSTVDRISP
jgi:hypothetical protein